jgi:hypothetical protein
MTGEEFTTLYRCCSELRQYVVDEAKRHTRDKDLQCDFIQEAWLRVSLCERDCSVQYLKQEAHRAIENYYRREKRRRTEKFEYVELMDRAVYEAWTRGYFRKW